MTNNENLLTSIMRENGIFHSKCLGNTGYRLLSHLQIHKIYPK